MERKTVRKSKPPTRPPPPPPAKRRPSAAPPPPVDGTRPNVAALFQDLNVAVHGEHLYDPLRETLYSPAELMAGYEPGVPWTSFDDRVYRHVQEHGHTHGRRPELREALTQRVHDFSIDAALGRLLDYGPDGLSRTRKVVGLMGGHEERRDSASYRKAAEVTRLLTREGFFIVTGGGPGMMEAGNLGAYLAGEPNDALDGAIETLSGALDYGYDKPEASAAYVAAAQAVLARHPKGHENLSIPTWFYGGEPTNLFATHVAKYFSNSIREEGLLAIASHGVVFAPGSAATRQEIFLNAAQNHYGEFGWCSPMVFLGTAQYRMLTQVFPLVQETANENYRDLLCLSDDPREIADFIARHPPRRPRLRD
jgi:predicted Rossmann-fold nucleotide-binding protein